MAAKKAHSLELRSIANAACQGGCNKTKRKEMTDDDICKTVVSELDGLPIRCVGSWAMRKIHFLTRYFAIFSMSMKNKWEGLNYIEICSGVGRCVSRDTCEEIDGTALSILNHPNLEFLQKAVFIDINEQVVETLNRRIKNLNHSDKALAVMGNYNDQDGLKAILEPLPKRSLNFVLLDPTDCSLPFKTIKLIKSILGKVDFLINVPLYMDAGRNLGKAILQPENHTVSLKKYSEFIGDLDFLYSREIVKIAQYSNAGKLRQLFIDKYIQQFETLGYTHFDCTQNVQNNGLYLYNLFFAAGHELALKFWREATTYDETGQISFLSQLK